MVFTAWSYFGNSFYAGLVRFGNYFAGAASARVRSRLGGVPPGGFHREKPGQAHVKPLCPPSIRSAPCVSCCSASAGPKPVPVDPRYFTEESPKRKWPLPLWRGRSQTCWPLSSARWCFYLIAIFDRLLRSPRAIVSYVATFFPVLYHHQH